MKLGPKPSGCCIACSVLAGFAVIDFTWHQLIDDTNWVARCIRSALGR